MSPTPPIRALLREAEEARERIARLAVAAKNNWLSQRELREVLLQVDRACTRAYFLGPLRFKWVTIDRSTLALRRFIRVRMKKEGKGRISEAYARRLRDQFSMLAQFWSELGIEWSAATLTDLLESTEEPRKWLIARTAEHHGVSPWTIRKWLLKGSSRAHR